MDVLKEIANSFPDRENLQRYRITLERFDLEISDVFLSIRNVNEQLRFLGYLKDVYENLYQEHIKECEFPDTCNINKSFEIALYAIQQAHTELLEEHGNISLSEKPAMQYFSEGQYFDAFSALRKCLLPANESIILIDGYVNADTLDFFPQKGLDFQIKIVTKSKSINQIFKLAIKAYKKQFNNLSVVVSEKYHDRFLVIDKKEFFHIGASIKDAGHKNFMFTRIESHEIKKLILDNLPEEQIDI